MFFFALFSLYLDLLKPEPSILESDKIKGEFIFSFLKESPCFELISYSFLE